MSKVNDIKNLKRKQRILSPTQALTEVVGVEESSNQEETNQQPTNVSYNEPNTVSFNEPTIETRKEETKVERKRVSFDLRTDLHKELKLQSLIQEKNIYILIEEALEKYLKEK